MDSLGGLKLYVDTYALSANVDVPGVGFVGEGQVSSLAGCGRPGGCGAVRIYTGGHWGPELVGAPILSNFSSSLPATSTGLVSVGMLTSVWYDSPVSADFQETGSQVVGNVTIVNSGGGGFITPGFLGFVILGGALGPVVLYVAERVTKRGS